MIRVTVEIIPHGDKNRVTEISKLEIINTLDHPRRPEFGNYTVYEDGEMFHVQNFKRSLGIGELLAQVFSVISKQRNKK